MLRLDSGIEGICMDLLHADTEDEVISILKQRGYWDDPTVWQPFGNIENNFPTMGNQTSKPEAALVEKLVNSIDAVLMGECWQAGMRPDSSEAPQTISEAVAEFFGGGRGKAETMGNIARWDNHKRRKVADRITLAATGSRQNMSFTIVDAGEGQSPNAMPDTLLSLIKSNKADVQFVQGKFNMGGTGALRFCGRENLQLIISKRNPTTKPNQTDDKSTAQWGFTIVRREPPTGQRRISMYKYLCPTPEGVLRFDADKLLLFPQGNKAYARAATWGTAIKLYEYKLTRKSHILRRRGLLQKLDLLLPRPALPIRLHECREREGGPGSFDTNLNGITVRLSDDRRGNLEPGFPAISLLAVQGCQLPVSIYAFKRGKADIYKDAEGILLTVNGQTHASLTQQFFARKAVNLDHLRDSLLVVVDCTDLPDRSREDLFMNSRDRVEEGEHWTRIERALETTLREHPGLRALKEQRRREVIDAKLQNAKPLRDVLESIVRKVPTLAQLFGGVGTFPNPFRSRNGKGGRPFVGRIHPTYFRFRDMNYGEVLQRTTAVNMSRSRIAFETDAMNDYFSRSQNSGRYTLRWADQAMVDTPVPDYVLNPWNGMATLNLALPETAVIGQSFEYELTVDDETLIEPFVNRFRVTVGPFQKPSSGNGQRRVGEEEGDASGATPRGLSIPTPNLVWESQWDKHAFDRFSALRVYNEWSEGSEGTHDYFINMDNVYLLSELKTTKANPEVVRSRWQFGLTLIGLALLKNLSAQKGSFAGEDPLTPEDAVLQTTRAIAPVLLPLIEHLGALSDEDISVDD